jgi:hypothetical protein
MNRLILRSRLNLLVNDRRSIRMMILAIILVSVLCSAILYVALHPVPIVLMFHSITDDRDGDSPDISPSRFRAVVTKVARRAAEIEITTDRTDSSIYSEFFRTLQEHGLTAKVFILPLEVGGENMLTWSQIREMDREGFIIGSQSLTHAWLPDLRDEEVACELCVSKALIEQQIGHAITTLAYPYGAFDTRVQRIARQCGYERAYATAPGRRYPDDDALAIKRVYVNEYSAGNQVLGWLALSGFSVTVRELALSLLPIKIPRKPADWSRDSWIESVKGIEGLDRHSPPCSTMVSVRG